MTDLTRVLKFILYPLLKLLSVMFGIIVTLRNLLYDTQVFRSYESGINVVSVGNLSVGGSGKTPLCDWIAARMVEANKSPALLCHGYKARIRGIHKVNLNSHKQTPQMFGDEALLLLLRQPNLPVYIAQDRVKACQYLASQGIQWVICDDAFQHRRLRRKIDIVAIDATQQKQDFELMPSGRAREPFSALNRAHIVALTKVNLVPNQKLQSLKETIASHMRPGIALFEFEYHIRQLSTLAGESIIKADKAELTNCYSVAAISRPESFVRILEDQLKLKIVGKSFFSDHYDYQQKDFIGILKNMNRLGSRHLIVTEKDWVKMADFLPLANAQQIRVFVAALELKCRQGVESFHAELSQHLR